MFDFFYFGYIKQKFMDVTDIVSKGLNHLEVKYDVDWWVIKKWNSNECHDYVTKLIESHPDDKVLEDLQNSVESISQEDFVISIEKYL